MAMPTYLYALVNFFLDLKKYLSNNINVFFAYYFNYVFDIYFSYNRHNGYLEKFTLKMYTVLFLCINKY